MYKKHIYLLAGGTAVNFFNLEMTDKYQSAVIFVLGNLSASSGITWLNFTNEEMDTWEATSPRSQRKHGVYRCVLYRYSEFKCGNMCAHI